MDVPYDEGAPPAGPRRLLGRMREAHEARCYSPEEAGRLQRAIARREQDARLDLAARVQAQEGGEPSAGRLAEMLLAWRAKVREEVRRDLAQLREELLGEMTRLLAQFAQRQGVWRG